MRMQSTFVKIVTAAVSADDGREILGLYNEVDSEATRPIAFAMGALEAESRILSGLKPNTPFVFASLDKPVAPGQLSVEQMHMEYDTLRYFPYIPFLM